MIGPSIRRPGAALIAAIAAGLFAAGAAAAEVVVLKSGGRIEGELVNPDRARTDPAVIVTPSGMKLSLSAAQVKRIVEQNDALKEYEDALPTLADSVEAHLGMAAWCLEAGLATQRKHHLEQVIRLDPDHEDARRMLGYTRLDGEWLKPGEWETKHGYVYFQSAWRLPQEVEILEREQKLDKATIQWRLDLKRWLGWLEDDGRKSSTAIQNIRSIRDDAAAPALVELLADKSRSRSLRLQSLELLSRMPGHYSASTLMNLAMKDEDDELRDKCLEELRRQRSTLALHSFMKDLKSKDNKVVRRAAFCLGVLGDVEATVPLIDALVTSHKFAVTPGGGNPGQLGAAFGGPTDGSGGGLGSFSFGSPKPQIKTFELKNDTALTALTLMHPGVNFQFDEKRWKAWVIDNKTSTDVDLRRGE